MKNGKVSGTIKSKVGFYVGDICYVLKDEIYDDFWIEEKNGKDGVHRVPGTGFSFAVAGTAHGDGCYQDNYSNFYPVDAGVIGVVPLELVSSNAEFGKVFQGAGTVKFEAENGLFSIILPWKQEILIATDFDDEDENFYDF